MSESELKENRAVTTGLGRDRGKGCVRVIDHHRNVVFPTARTSVRPLLSPRAGAALPPSAHLTAHRVHPAPFPVQCPRLLQALRNGLDSLHSSRHSATLATPSRTDRLLSLIPASFDRRPRLPNPRPHQAGTRSPLRPFLFAVPPPARTALLALTSTVALVIPLIIFYTWHSHYLTWHEPDPHLLSSPYPPHTYAPHCDASLGGPLLFIAIFSKSSNVDKRSLVRLFEKPELPPPESGLIEFRFILGRPADRMEGGGSMEDWDFEIRRENEKEGDLVVLDVEENMDDGKTHAFFKWLATERAGPKPQFVLKADDDTYLVIPNLISAFRSFNCSQNVYLGTTRGADPRFPNYFRGLGYALSLPLYTWLGASTPTDIGGYEDARTGAWLQSLDPKTDPVQRLDVGFAMGDWNQIEVGTATLGLHWLKENGWWPGQVRRVHAAWQTERRAFRWDNGRPIGDVVAFGHKKPDDRRIRFDIERLGLDPSVPVGAWRIRGLSDLLIGDDDEPPPPEE